MVGGQQEGRKLRVGLLVDSLVLPRWVARVVREIQDSDVAEVSLVIQRQAPADVVRSANLVARVWRKRRQLLPALFNRLDARLFGVANDPFEPTDLSAELDAVPVVRLTPRLTAHSDYFPDVQADEIAQHDLDVALRFGFRILRGRALGIARYGVWSYHHGDNRVNRGGPAGFWEVVEQNPVTGSILQVLTEELDAGHVMYRSWSATDRRSVTRNKANFYWKSSAFVMRKLREVAERGEMALKPPVGEGAGWEGYGNRLYAAPDNATIARHVVATGGRYIGDRVRRATSHDQWTLAYHIATKASEPDVPAGAPFRFKALVPPHDRFWADPFVVPHADGWTVFFEELVYREINAHISAFTISRDGSVGTPERVLERDYRLSYPFMLEWNGQWWMIPESAQNRTVELYRATDFPRGWVLESVLLENVNAVDATIVQIEGRWWMFVNIAEEGASTLDELHLFAAPSPLGPWSPHRRNPVKSDVRSARPAGRPFFSAGAWYRPSQDCSVSYGWAIVMNRIERIDDDEYREVEVSRILPEWRPELTGIHTINAAAGLTVIDVRVLRRRW